MKFQQIRNGMLLWTYENEEGPLDGYIEHYRVSHGDWAVGLYSHLPAQATPLFVKLSSAGGKLDYAFVRHNPGSAFPLSPAIQIAIIYGIQLFKAYAFEKLARGFAQSTLDLS